MVVAWVAANAILGAIKAVSAFLFLTWMGVPGALLWSVLTFFSALVPQVGFYVMSIPPVLMAFTVDATTALWTALFFWALSTLLGNFVAPRIQGERMKLHPAYILGATVAFGYAFGVLGVLIAAPVAGFAWAFFDAFYLERRPPVEPGDPRVDAILERNPAGAE
jgi:putative permease